MSPGIEDSERFTVLGRYMNTLKISGYDQGFRFTLLKGVLKRFEETERSNSRAIAIEKQIESY